MSNVLPTKIYHTFPRGLPFKAIFVMLIHLHALIQLVPAVPLPLRKVYVRT